MKGLIRTCCVALLLAVLTAVGPSSAADAQSDDPPIVIQPSPTSDSSAPPTWTSSPTSTQRTVRQPTHTATQPVIVVATTAVPTATPTPTRPSPTPSSTTGITPTDTREPTKTPTLVVLPAGGVDIRGDNNLPSPSEPEPQAPDGNRLKVLALLGFGLAGAVGAGLLGLGLLRPRRGAATGRRTYEPLVFRKRIDKASPATREPILEDLVLHREMDNAPGSRVGDVSAGPGGSSPALPDPILDDRAYTGVDKGAEADPDQPAITGRMWNDAAGGGHSGWIELQGVNQGGSAGAAPKLMQYCASGPHPPAPGSRSVHFSYDILGNRTESSVQQMESSFQFLHERAGDPTGMWRLSDHNPALQGAPPDSGGASVEVRGWDVENKPPAGDRGDQGGQFNFRVEIEGVENSRSGFSSPHTGGANMLMGDGNVHDTGSDVLVSPNGDMLALKEGLASHSGMSAGQVDKLYQAIGEQINASLPAGLRWAQILWRLVPV